MISIFKHEKCLQKYVYDFIICERREQDARREVGCAWRPRAGEGLSEPQEVGFQVKERISQRSKKASGPWCKGEGERG